MTKPKSKTMSNYKAQMSNEKKGKTVVRGFSLVQGRSGTPLKGRTTSIFGFDCNLGFDIWVLFAIWISTPGFLRGSGSTKGLLTRESIALYSIPGIGKSSQGFGC